MTNLRKSRFGDKLLNAITGTETSNVTILPKEKVTFQATGNASHSGSSTIVIEVSNDKVQFHEAATISLSGANDTALFPLDASYNYARADCTAHGGGTVTVSMG